MRASVIWPVLGVAGTLVVGVALAFSSGAPVGVTGAPGEGTCTSCHTSFPLNSGPDQFATTAPFSLVGQGTFTVSATFMTTSGAVHGFEVTARDSANNAAGTWTITNPSSTQLLSPGNHVTHTTAGSGQTSWSMDWTRPGTLPAGPVTFYAAGVAGNGSQGANGDQVYTATAKVYQARISTPNTGWPIGTTQVLDLDAPTQPASTYIALVSELSGPPTMAPSGIEIPLARGLLTDLAFSLPSVFQGFVGSLNSLGQGQAQVVIPSEAGLVGRTIYFAFVTVDTSVATTETSNRISVTFQ